MSGTRRFEYRKGESRKFWAVFTARDRLVFQFGKIGTAGQFRDKLFDSAGAASAAAKALVREKLAKGYVEVGRAAPRRAKPLRPRGAARDDRPAAATATVPKLAIARLVPAPRPVRKPVTKFGGQPVWVGEPQWPISRRHGLPMRFIAQVALERRVFEDLPATVAYVFATHFEWPIADDWFEEDALVPGRGENAVILQPGGRPDVETVDATRLARGPTLYRADGAPCEYVAKLAAGADPPFVSASAYARLPRAEQRAHADAVEGDKVGGVPSFFQGDGWPPGHRQAGWRLALQFDTSRPEFRLNFGDAVLYAFVSADGRRGVLTAQR